MNSKIRQDWEFLILLLDLPFPVYNALIWVLQICCEPEPPKQLYFLNRLVSKLGFVSYQNEREMSVRRGYYIKPSARDPNIYISVELESGGPHPAGAYQVVRVMLNQSRTRCLKQINWHWKEDSKPIFLFWDQSCPFGVMTIFEGDYYQSRAAFMNIFASILDSNESMSHQ